MRRGWASPEEGQWARFGFLFADLFTALAMIFLLANTTGQAASTGASSSAKQQQCGLESQAAAPITLTLTNADDLRSQNNAAAVSFDKLFRGQATGDTGRIVGLAEVFGGSYSGQTDVADGLTLAKGAVYALSLPAPANAPGPVFSQKGATVFQAFWDGDLKSAQVKVVMYFYQSGNGSSCAPA